MSHLIFSRAKSSQQRWTIITLLLISLALLTYTIIRSVRVEMTMDEIYTWENLGKGLYPAVYDHTTANNHWLNSWLMQLSESIFGTHEWALRLPNLIAHACFLFFTARIALSFRNGVYTVAAFVLLNAHPYMLDFFSAARGYGIALGCIAACLFYLFRFVSEGQATKHVVYIMLAAMLAMLANFAVISFVMMATALTVFFVLRKKSDKRIKQLLLIAAVVIPVLAFTVPHLLRMQASGALYYGEETFWNGTVKTMVNKLLFDKIYHDTNSFRYFQPALVALILFLVAGAALLIRKNGFENWLRSSPGITFTILSGVIVIIVLQHILLGTLYPIQRVALFIFVLFIFAIVTTLNELLQGRALAIAGTLPAITIAFYMFHFGNTGYLSEWEYSAGTQKAVDIITDKYSKTKDGKPVTISAMGGAGFPLEFIKKKDSLNWMDVRINWQSDQPSQHDFYLIESWAIPSFNVTHWIPVDTLPYSGNMLYMDSAFVSRMK
jgi:hypothetical protein